MRMTVSEDFYTTMFYLDVVGGGRISQSISKGWNDEATDDFKLTKARERYLVPASIARLPIVQHNVFPPKNASLTSPSTAQTTCSNRSAP